MQHLSEVSLAAHEKAEVDVPLNVKVKLQQHTHCGFDQLYDKSVVELSNSTCVYSLGANLVLQRYNVESAPAEHLYLSKPNFYFLRQNKLYLLPNEDSSDAINPQSLELPSVPLRTTAFCAHPSLPLLMVAEVAQNHDHARILICTAPTPTQSHNMELEPLVVGIIYVSLRHKVVVQPTQPRNSLSISQTPIIPGASPTIASSTRACTHVAMMRVTNTGLVVVGDGPLWPLWHVDLNWEKLAGNDVSGILKGSKWSQYASREPNIANMDSIRQATPPNSEIELFYTEKPRLLKSPVHSIDVTVPLALSSTVKSLKSKALPSAAASSLSLSSTSRPSSAPLSQLSTSLSTSYPSVYPSISPPCSEEWLLCIACEDGVRLCWPNESHIAMSHVQIEGEKLRRSGESGNSGYNGIFPEYSRDATLRQVIDRSLSRRLHSDVSADTDSVENSDLEANAGETGAESNATVNDAGATVTNGDADQRLAGQSQGKGISEGNSQDSIPSGAKSNGIDEDLDLEDVNSDRDLGMMKAKKKAHNGTAWGVMRARTRSKHKKMRQLFGNNTEDPEKSPDQDENSQIPENEEPRYFRDGIPGSYDDAYGNFIHNDLFGSNMRANADNLDDKTNNSATAPHDKKKSAVDKAPVLQPRIVCCWLHSHSPEQLQLAEHTLADMETEALSNIDENTAEEEKTEIVIPKSASHLASLAAALPYSTSTSLLSVPARLPLLVIACGARVLVLGWENIRKNGGLNAGKVNFRVLQVFRTDLLEENIETVMSMESVGAPSLPPVLSGNSGEIIPNPTNIPINLAIMGISRSLEASANDAVIASSPTSASSMAHNTHNTEPSSMCRLLLFTPPSSPPPSRVQRTLNSNKSLRNGQQTLYTAPQRLCVMGIEVTLDEIEEEEREKEWNLLREKLPQEKQKSRERGWSRPVSATTRSTPSAKSGKSKKWIPGNPVNPENSFLSGFTIGDAALDPLYLSHCVDLYSPFTQKVVETNFWDQIPETESKTPATTPQFATSSKSNDIGIADSENQNSGSPLPLLPLSFSISPTLAHLSLASHMPSAILSLSLASLSSSSSVIEIPPPVHTITHQPSFFFIPALTTVAKLAPFLIVASPHPLSNAPSHTRSRSLSSMSALTSSSLNSSSSLNIATLHILRTPALTPLASMPLAYRPLAVTATPDANVIAIASMSALHVYNTSAHDDMTQPMPLTLRPRVNMPVLAKTTHLLCSQGAVQVFILITTNFIVTLCPLTLKQYAYLDLAVPINTAQTQDILSQLLTTDMKGQAEVYQLPFLDKANMLGSLSITRDLLAGKASDKHLDEDIDRNPLSNTKRKIVSLTPTHSGLFVVNSETKPLSRYSDFFLSFFPSRSALPTSTSAAVSSLSQAPVDGNNNNGINRTVTSSATTSSTATLTTAAAATAAAATAALNSDAHKRNGSNMDLAVMNNPVDSGMGNHAGMGNRAAVTASAVNALSISPYHVVDGSTSALSTSTFTSNPQTLSEAISRLSPLPLTGDLSHLFVESAIISTLDDFMTTAMEDRDTKDTKDTKDTEESEGIERVFKLPSSSFQCLKIRVPLPDTSISNNLGKTAFGEHPNSHPEKHGKSGKKTSEVTAVGYSSLSLLTPQTSRRALLPCSLTATNAVVLSHLARSLVNTHAAKYFAFPRRPLAALVDGGATLCSGVYATYCRSLRRDEHAEYQVNNRAAARVKNGNSENDEKSGKIGSSKSTDAKTQEKTSSTDATAPSLQSKIFSVDYADENEFFLPPYTPTLVSTTVNIGMCEFLVVGTHTGHLSLLSLTPPSREMKKKQEIQRKYALSMQNISQENDTRINDINSGMFSSLSIHDTIAVSSAPIVGLHFLPSLSPLQPPSILCLTLDGAAHIVNFPVSFSLPAVKTPLKVALYMHSAVKQLYKPQISYSNPAHAQRNTSGIPAPDSGSRNSEFLNSSVTNMWSYTIPPRECIVSVPYPTHLPVPNTIQGIEIGGRYMKYGEFNGSSVNPDLNLDVGTDALGNDSDSYARIDKLERSVNLGDVMLLSSTNAHSRISVSAEESYVSMLEHLYEYMQNSPHYAHLDILQKTVSPYLKQSIMALMYGLMLVATSPTGYAAKLPSAILRLGNSHVIRNSFFSLFPNYIEKYISDISVAISGMARDASLSPVRAHYINNAFHAIEKLPLKDQSPHEHDFDAENPVSPIGLPQWLIPISSEAISTSHVILQSHQRYLLQQIANNQAISSCFLMLSHERERRNVLVKRETDILYSRMKEEERKRIVAEEHAAETRRKCEEWVNSIKQERKEERKKLLMMYEERLSKEAARVRCIVEANEAMMVACEKTVSEVEKQRDAREEVLMKILQDERKKFNDMIVAQESKHKNEQEMVLRYLTEECDDVELTLMREKMQAENTETRFKNRVAHLEIEDKVTHGRLRQAATKIRELDTEMETQKQTMDKILSEKYELEKTLSRERESHASTRNSCAAVERELQSMIHERDVLAKEIKVLNEEVQDMAKKLIFCINKTKTPSTSLISEADAELLRAQAQIVKLRESLRDSEARGRALRVLLSRQDPRGGRNGFTSGSSGNKGDGDGRSRFEVVGGKNGTGIRGEMTSENFESMSNDVLAQLGNIELDATSAHRSDKDQELITQLVSQIRKQEEVIDFFRNQVIKQKQTNHLDRSQRLLMATKAAEELRATREMLLITRKEKHSLENELLAAKGLATNARHESRIDAMAAEARELRDKPEPARITGNGTIRAPMKAPLPAAAKGQKSPVSRPKTGKSAGNSGTSKNPENFVTSLAHISDADVREEYDQISARFFDDYTENAESKPISTSTSSRNREKHPILPENEKKFDFDAFMASARAAAEAEDAENNQHAQMKPSSLAGGGRDKNDKTSLRQTSTLRARPWTAGQVSSHSTSSDPVSNSTSSVSSSDSHVVEMQRRLHAFSTLRSQQTPVTLATGNTPVTNNGDSETGTNDSTSRRTTRPSSAYLSSDASRMRSQLLKDIPIDPRISRQHAVMRGETRAESGTQSSAWKVKKEAGKDDVVMFNWSVSSPERRKNRNSQENPGLMAEATPASESVLSKEDRKKLGIAAAKVALTSSLQSQVSEMISNRRQVLDSEAERAKALNLLKDIQVNTRTSPVPAAATGFSNDRKVTFSGSGNDRNSLQNVNTRVAAPIQQNPIGSAKAADIDPRYRKFTKMSGFGRESGQDGDE